MALKYYVDVEKTLGKNLLLAGVTDWKDYNTQERKGLKFEVVCVDRAFDKVKVKVSTDKDKETYSKYLNQNVAFSKLEGTVYSLQQGRIDISLTAEAIGVLKSNAVPGTT